MSKPAPAAEPVRVEIYDQSYNLRGTDPEYIHKLAEYVDLKMRTVAQQTQTIDSLPLAVLAALNIADQYRIPKRKFDAASGDCLQKADDLSQPLDEVLNDRRAG